MAVASHRRGGPMCLPEMVVHKKIKYYKECKLLLCSAWQGIWGDSILQ